MLCVGVFSSLARFQPPMWKLILLAAAIILTAAPLIAYWSYRNSAAETEVAFGAVAARANARVQAFDPATVRGFPEIARRYFTHAIAPGTPLSTTVRLEMQGTFLLGDKASYRSFGMTAQQILAPPSEFVWVTSMRSGVVRVSGSDALVAGSAWTRFWINSIFQIVNLKGTPDLNRSAAARSAMEAVWAPASLLPDNGVRWEQTGPDAARLFFNTEIEPLDLTLGADGRVVEIVTMRWSDANPEKTFRLQPFGGTVEADTSFSGFTIPSELKVGNHYGTDAYLPFFQAEITAAEYL